MPENSWKKKGKSKFLHKKTESISTNQPIETELNSPRAEPRSSEGAEVTSEEGLKKFYAERRAIQKAQNRLKQQAQKNLSNLQDDTEGVTMERNPVWGHSVSSPTKSTIKTGDVMFTPPTPEVYNHDGVELPSSPSIN